MRLEIAKFKRLRKSTGIMLAITAALLLIIVIAASEGPSAVDVDSCAVERGSISQSIPASGKIRPAIEVKVSPDVSGEIVELNFSEGDTVRAGDLVIRIRPDTYESMVERAEASLNAVKAQYHQQKTQRLQSEMNFRRSRRMFEHKVISEAEFEAARTEYEVAGETLKAAGYNVASAEASLKEARENLLKTSIYAPMDGIISRMNVGRGERVVGTSQMAGTELFRVADFGRMEVLVDVNENDIVRISCCDSAFVEVDAYPGRKFAGKVGQIANSAKNIGSFQEQVTNFEVDIELLAESYQDLLDSNPIPFRPGMSASVTIVTQARHDVLTVPVEAVISADGHGSVFVCEDGTARQVTVHTGIRDLDRVEITSGLEEGDIVVTGPYRAIRETLHEGSRIHCGNERKKPHTSH